MTNQTNGASLEDCHTNFFALADLCGIRWRKLVLGERPNCSGEPLDDPVLRSYSRCLAVDILCVWRRVAAPKPEPDQTGGIFDISLTGPGNSGSVTHPPLSLTAAKELWIFYYGEPPDLSNLLAPELLKSSDGVEGSWESGLSYECRSLLFKALHNLIERCLLSRDVIRLGKWFVQPCSTDDRIFGKSSAHLSFSFAFFVHGDSTVCASMDIREHPPVRPLTTKFLNDAQKVQQNAELQPKAVILAPFGLAATLTGNSFKTLDNQTQKILDDWAEFYPLCNNRDNSDLPPVVEVVSGGVKMRYPSKYVLVTVIDDLVNNNNSSSNNNNVHSFNNLNSTKQRSSSDNLLNGKEKCTLIAPLTLPETPVNDLGHPLSMTMPQSTATILPERVWQDCVMNPSFTNAMKNGNGGLLDELTGSGSGEATTNTDLWECTDPMLKANCVCAKFKKLCGRQTTGSGLKSSRSDKAGRTRIAFHKRLPQKPSQAFVGSQFSSTCSTTTTTNTTTTTITPSTTNSLDAVVNVSLLTSNQRPTGSSTPHGGPPSYSRNPLSVNNDQFPIPSVDSPSSISASPLPIQPSSVPPSDQMNSTLSPHQPSSVNPQSVPPTTPLVDPLDKNSSVDTPTDQHDIKNVPESSYHPKTPTTNNVGGSGPTSSEQQQSNGGGAGDQGNLSTIKKLKSNATSAVTAGAATATTNQTNSNLIRKNSVNTNSANNANNNKSINCKNNNLNSVNSNNFANLLKRPILSSRDYESIVDEDYIPRQSLYDYSTWEAWTNHPVKRYKPNEDTKPTRSQLNNNNDSFHGGVYNPAQHPGQQSHENQQSGNFGLNESKNGILNGIDEARIKSELPDEDELGRVMGEKGAGAGCGEVALGPDGEPIINANEIKKEVSDDERDKFPTNLFTNEGLQPSYKDLDQIFDNSDDDMMFPLTTPPGSNKSLGGCIIDDNPMSNKRKVGSSNPNTSILRPEELSKMFPTPPSLEHHPNSSPGGGTLSDSGTAVDSIMDHLPSRHQDIYPNLGSPIAEPIDDWSYVYMPPPMCQFVGSSKYAPLTNLPSQSLSPIVLAPSMVYKPSWLNQQQQQQKKQQQQQQQQKQQQQQEQQRHLQSKQEKTQTIPVPLSTPNSQMGPRPLSRPGSASLPGSSGGMMVNSMMNSNNMYMPLGHQPGGNMRVLPSGMSPISPVTPYPAGHIINVQSPIQNPFRRTPIPAGAGPPPPPYDIAVASPATSTSSSYMNRQFSSNDPMTPTNGANGTTSGTGGGSPRPPEANALLVNVLLYDTLLNIFRDHNFDACTLCVCSSECPGVKWTGNIRGADSGVYLPLPGSGNGFSGTNGSGGHHSGYSGYGMLDSPAGNGNYNQQQQQNQNGYLDEDPINCRCGFSAVVNRRLGHRAGLFYEDELEITGMAEDPANYKKGSLMKFLFNGDSDRNLRSALEDGNSCDSLALSPPPMDIVDLLREQCSVIQSASSSIQRAVRNFKSRVTSQTLANKAMNVLEFTDAHDIINLALEQGRQVFDSQQQQQNGNKMDMDPYQQQMRGGSNMVVAALKATSTVSVHKWPYVRAKGPRCNNEIVRIMNSMQPLLQDAFHKKCTTRLWEAPYTVQGPLTWRQFHRLAVCGTGQCEPQPIPSVIVGHEKDLLCLSPYAIQYWDKLLLEPYAYPRDIAYIIVAPDNDYVVARLKLFFKELSTTYEMCKLGRHTPIKRWDNSILRVGKAHTTKEGGGGIIDDWFNSLGDGQTSELLRMYAQACQHTLTPLLAKIPTDKSILDPPDLAAGGNSLGKDRPLPSPMPPPSTPDPDKPPTTPKSEPNDSATDLKDTLNTSGGSTPSSSSQQSTPPLSTDSFKRETDEVQPPHVVIYLVEPFTCGSDSPDLQRLACLALLRCYSNILQSIPESVRNNISVQIISLESVLEMSRTRERLRWSDHMRSLALSVFSQSRRFISHVNNVKSLTGFGTAANADIFLKSKDEKNRRPYKLYTPPYILSAQHVKSENAETFGQASVEQQCSVMYCSYCLSEDQSWLLAVATDDRGELLETVTINIDIPNRNRRKRASARRMGLQKLMDFILGVISQSVQPWRLVIGRIGRIGHGELKGWSWLLSKPYLLKASKHLKEICEQCALMYPHAAPSILSACLITLEPDSTLRVMSDQFTPDERFSQISVQSALSTPQDVTSTHILVFPISATTQSSQVAFQEKYSSGGCGLGIDEDMEFLNDLGGDAEDGMENLGDIFGYLDENEQMPQQNDPILNSPTGSIGMEDNRSRQSCGQGGGNGGMNRGVHMLSQEQEDVGQLLQQPLALGYLVSTAPTGRMPSWFWSSCPHLEGVCPVFLKTALHLHSSSSTIYQNNDDILQQQQSSATEHPLDSQLTADVLRYVLEGYNVLSWLAIDSNTHDRLSCLPIHVQVLMQLYHMTAALS